ncbi:tyrosine-type recombinase/integrase [Neoaquamicrobium sediminum]|uniref:tyrosine-type recombinase/integrase n=1 Tax=Neoaquamicrobium sediminum TaxID=1849104 RepID=UPI004035640E
MVRASLHRLSAKAVENATKKGDKATLIDGGGLMLVIDPKGARWVFRYTSPVATKRRDMGLGSFAHVSLAIARDLASEAREKIARGVDPLDERKRDRDTALTFEMCAEQTLAVLEAEWSTVATADQWRSNVKSHCKPIASIPVRDLTVDDIKRTLAPLDATPTIKRLVLSIIRRTIDFAIAKGLRTDNPADTRRMKLVTSLRHATKHNGSMPYPAVPAFVKQLREKGSPAARCLEFIILTGARKREATEMKWHEVDFAKQLWTIPAERMKARREHTVPLTDATMKLLLSQQLRHPDSEYVWPGAMGGRNTGRKGRADHISHGAFQHLLPKGTTVHGFRSSLREYLGDETTVSYTTAEEVLSHRVGDATVKAYRRASGLAKRRAALTYWCDFVNQRKPADNAEASSPVATDNVHPIRKAAS